MKDTKYCLNCNKKLVKHQKYFCSRKCRGEYPIDESTRQKMSTQRKGRELTDEWKHKLSLAGIGNKNNSGKRRTKEQREKMSKVVLGRSVSQETREKLRLVLTGKKRTLEQIERISTAHKGRFVSEETKRKVSQSLLGNSRRKGYIEKEEVRRRLSVSQKKSWENPEIAHVRLIGLGDKPNKSEKKVLSLLDMLFPSEWKYVGNGNLIIDGKCPDFVNSENNKLIEFNGEYWHKYDDLYERFDLFLSYGYDTLFIWSNEMKNLESVKEKIINFIFGKSNMLMTQLLKT